MKRTAILAKKRALLSVYDKRGIEAFAAALVELGFEIVSTGGTKVAIAEADVPVVAVSDVTGFPEILDGRVKTLHPLIHGGLLGRTDLEDHRLAMQQHGVRPIQVLAVNLYPFEQTVANETVTMPEAIEQIDIGGPAMIRAAAKNFANVIVLVDPADYREALDRIRRDDADLAWRRQLATRAFAHTSAYDAVVAGFLGDAAPGSLFPAELTIAGRKAADLRYGENPQQAAAAYRRLRPGRIENGVLDARQLGGKELSYNNMLDADVAWSAVYDLKAPAAAIVKHNLPCGLAMAGTVEEAFTAALAGDPVSAFGGIVSFNREVNLETARRISKVFFEIVLAPSFTSDALELLAKKQQLRLLEMPAAALRSPLPDWQVRPIRGGLLLQEPDLAPDDVGTWQVVTSRQPSAAERRDLEFAWRAVRLVKSNAIVLVVDNAVVGVGGGQPNRLESINFAVRKAADRAAGSVLASDAFFPFADNVEAAAAAGVTAVVQPGGSIRDAEVIARAEELELAMVMTGRRHFLH